MRLVAMAPGEPCACACAVEKRKGKHLIVLANGLWGQAAHWDVVKTAIDQRLRSTSSRRYHVHVSKSNQLFDTYAGIDACGDRLKRELDELVRMEHADADAISFIGHSMGGLITRSAVAKAYDREKKKVVLGGRELEPTHFVSLATPHVGFGDSERCPLDNAWYIPFSRWVVPYVSSRILGETGKQFFNRDEDKLIMRMAGDDALQALGAFKTRTAYANVSGDHLVGWGGSSLRQKDEMAEARKSIDALRDVKHRGVVREDALEAALSDKRTSEKEVQTPSSMNLGNTVPETQDEAMANISRLGWRRVDVNWKDARLPGLAHQHIMAQRKRINGVGKETARHVAEQLYRYEEHFER